MFELTGAITYALPIMASIMVSKWVGDAFSVDSIYGTIILTKDRMIFFNGHPYLNNKGENFIHFCKTKDILIKIPTFNLNINYTFEDIERFMELVGIF